MITKLENVSIYSRFTLQQKTRGKFTSSSGEYSREFDTNMLFTVYKHNGKSVTCRTNTSGISYRFPKDTWVSL